MVLVGGIRVLADFPDALGRGEPVDLPAWQAGYLLFASDLADLLVFRPEQKQSTVPAAKPLPFVNRTDSLMA
jgi:hypothetical protein